jgi:HD-GYP domain-containing protein (c-di-GMP phosphodiesterase class II)
MVEYRRRGENKMRYITISRLQDGMTLARPLLGGNFGTLLREGMTLEEHHIRRINEMGYGGVYIHDELSEGLSPNDPVSFDTRVATIRSAKEILEQAANGRLRGSARMTRQRQDKIFMPIIDDIIDNPKRIMDFIDMKPYDHYTFYHSANVVILSVLVGVELGLSGNRLYELALGSLLYDLGNIFLPKGLLNKPGKLSPEEFDEIKRHTQLGFEYLRENFDISIEGCMGALQHHENYDGTGYPTGLKRDKISIYGRIIAVTDVFDALISRRPYRQPMFPCTAMEYAEMKSGTLFDPSVVSALKNVVASYPTGMLVETSTGISCIVTDNTPGHGDKPQLRMLGGLSRTPLVANLATDKIFAGVQVSHILDR